MPSASESTATAVKTGLRRNVRSPNRRSFHMEAIVSPRRVLQAVLQIGHLFFGPWSHSALHF